MVRMAKELRKIPVNDIMANKDQPRKYFDEESIRELSESIRAVGIIQPLTVRERMDGKFDLISGERRLRAAKVAGLAGVPCVVIKVGDEEVDVMSLVENIQREDLSFIEEAKAYAKLINDYGFTQQQLCEKVGKKQSTVSNKMRILRLGDEVLTAIATSGLTERHARALLGIPDTGMRLRAVETIVKRDLNVRQTEELVERLKGEVLINAGKKNIKNKFNYKVYTNTIKQAYDTIKKSGLNVDYDEVRYTDRVEVKITIPIAGA